MISRNVSVRTIRSFTVRFARPIAALVLLSVPGAVRAQSTPPAEWTALTTNLVRASDNGAIEGLRAARAAALRIVIAPMKGVPPALVLYTVAYADYRLATSGAMPASDAHDLADEAIADLHDAIAADPKLADAQGLLSAVLGLEIGWAASVDAKMAMGPESSAALDRALALEPNNPRLFLIQGVGLFRRPAEYGGDARQAEVLFRRAADALDAAKDPGWPNWGRFDAHVWLGQAIAQRGDAAGARVEYQKALAIAPDSAWVKGLVQSGGE